MDRLIEYLTVEHEPPYPVDQARRVAEEIGYLTLASAGEAIDIIRVIERENKIVKEVLDMPHIRQRFNRVE